MTTPGKMIGVDVGGTFTDVFVLDEATGQASVAKVPTTRPDQSGGFLEGIGRQVTDLSTASVVVHGTTAGTNALLERKGARISAAIRARSAFVRRRRPLGPSIISSRETLQSPGPSKWTPTLPSRSKPTPPMLMRTENGPVRSEAAGGGPRRAYQCFV